MKKYIFTGAAVFLCAMIAYVPASVAGKFLPNNIVANQFQGSLWNGSAASFVVDDIDYGSVKWKIKSSCFLILKLCADIKQNHIDIDSSFSLKMRRQTEINNLIARGNVMVLNSVFKNFGVSLTGDFDANMQEIQFDTNGIQRLHGKINFSSLNINGVFRLSMGDVSGVFEPMNDYTQIDIKNSQGHADLVGTIQLYNDMRYQFDMNAKKNASSTEAVINGLKFMGALQEDGSFNLQHSGGF